MIDVFCYLDFVSHKNASTTGARHCTPREHHRGRIQGRKCRVARGTSWCCKNKRSDDVRPGKYTCICLERQQRQDKTMHNHGLCVRYNRSSSSTKRNCIGESSPSLYSTCFPRCDDSLFYSALADFVEHANVDIVDAKRRQVNNQKFRDGNW